MKKPIYAVVLALGLWSFGAATADADHDLVYAPCDPEDGRPWQERIWFIDYQTGDMRRYDDPWWAEKPSLLTNWGHQCSLGATGVWQHPINAGRFDPLPHPPTHVTETRPPATTTTTIAPSSTVAPSSTTTVILTTATAPPTTTVPPQPAPPQDEPEPPPVPESLPAVGLSDGYDLFDAEWDGYPFEQTILLLEERYPPGTPDRFHFRLSVAVEFLRQGGMVKGLDNLWESG